jgi:hypothetical protein
VVVTFKTFHEIFWLCVFIVVWVWMMRFLRSNVIPAFRSGALVFPKRTFDRVEQPALFWLAIVACILALLALSFGILARAALLLA